jgi:hypothetical protein
MINLGRFNMKDPYDKKLREFIKEFKKELKILDGKLTINSSTDKQRFTEIWTFCHHWWYKGEDYRNPNQL